jgi:hypothetical protein
MKKILAVLALVFGAGSAAFANPVITSYDVEHAVAAGFGGWYHTYTGSITGTSFTDLHYTGGSGTLNDGSLGTSVNNTQLFTNLGILSITLHLDQSYDVKSLNVYGGNFSGNFIPGTLSGLSVTINGSTAALSGSDFGVHSDFFDLVGTGLESLHTNQIVLNNFQGGWSGYASIAEIEVNGVQADGTPSSAVPEPASLALLGMGLAGLAFSKRKKQA